MSNISNKIQCVVIVVLVCLGSLFAPAYGASCWFPKEKLTASDGAANDWFGGGDWTEYGNAHSVGIDGEWVVVGAYLDDWSGKTDAGSAYFYKKNAGVWEQKPRAAAGGADANSEDWFGRSVAISGEWAIIGAPDNHTADYGAVYIFHLENGNWVRKAKKIATDHSAGDKFGYSVAMKGDYAIVGAPGVDAPGESDAGAAYILKRDGTTWSQTAILIPTDRYENDYFGGCVGLSSDASNAIIGAFKNDFKQNPDSGSAYIFHFDGSNWTETPMLTASDGETGDLFGTSVSIDGNWAIVGAQMKFDDDEGRVQAGAAYIFNFNGSSWAEDSNITPYDADSYKEYGVSVAINGDFAIVGEAESGPGAAYVYANSPSGWVFMTKLVTSSDGSSESMGWSVAIEANGICQAVAGAPVAGPPGYTNYTGAAYVFAGPSFTVTAPNGSEEWLADSNQVITWVSNCTADMVNIDLFDGSAWSNIATVSDNGSWTWSSVLENVNSENCLIRISYADHTDIYDTSDAVFAVKDIFVDSPDGGELIQAGSQYTMTWRTKPGLSTIMFDYSTDNGAIWKPLGLLANDGTDSWLVPFDPSNQCLVKLSDPNNMSSAYDTSDHAFTIEIPGDLNHNGFVDFSDMAVFADNWLTGIP